MLLGSDSSEAQTDPADVGEEALSLQPLLTSAVAVCASTLQPDSHLFASLPRGSPQGTLGIRPAGELSPSRMYYGVVHTPDSEWIRVGNKCHGLPNFFF